MRGVLGAWCLVLGGWCLDAQAFALVENGLPKCGLVVAKDAHPATVTAAEELTNWVAKITGAEIGVAESGGGGRTTISFALRDEPRLKDTDGYLVDEKGGNLTIVAKYPKGHLNGVFRLLYRNTDIIWPRPGTAKDPVAVYSEAKTLEFRPETYARPDVPAFKLRHDGYNTSAEGYRWDMRNCLVTPGNWRWFWDKLEAAENGRRLGIWDSYYNSWGGAHNMVAWWFPRKEHEEHPEYYMLTATGRDKTNTGLCVSNPDLPQAFADAVLKKLEDKKTFPESVREVAILMEDSDATCRCKDCNAPFTCYDGTVITPKDRGYKSTRFFDFFTKALAKVWEKHPDLVVRQYAYVYLAEPPRVKIPKNLKLEFCPYPRDMKQSVFEGPDCADWKRMADGWLSLTKNIFWREYYFCGCIYYPRPISDTAEVDFKYLSKADIPVVYCDGCTSTDSRIFHKGVYTSVKQPTAEFWDTVGVEKWVVGQLMWDPSVGAKALREEYLKRVFREASPAMIRFYDILNASWYATKRASGWSDAAYPSAAYYIVQTGHTDEVRKALGEAAKAAVHPVAKEWVANVRRIVENWIKESPNYLTGPMTVPFKAKPAEFPHFKYLCGVSKKGKFNEPYGVKAGIRSNGEAFELGFVIPHADGEKGAPSVEVFFALKDEKAYKRYAATATAGKDAWVLKMTVPFAELDFKPIRINTIRCAPIVTYNFGGLGKDLPCSWEGAVPTSIRSWGELIVDIR